MKQAEPARQASAVQQSIRYLTTRDNTRLAWARAGSGPPLVKAANWLTHLEFDLEGPVWRHWTEFFASHYEYYRFDERGNGLSQHAVEDLGPERWVEDLEDVIEAAQPPEPFILLGMSQGCAAAIEYAVRHPQKVSHLVLFGGYSLGWRLAPECDYARRMEAITELIELGWGTPDPVFRRLYTKQFIAQGSEEQLDWFDRMCTRATTPELAARLMRSRGDVNVRHLLPKVQVPTLVAQCSGDQIVPRSNGQYLAAHIPGAEYLELDSDNHILLPGEAASERLQEAILSFTGVARQALDKRFADLTERERDILRLLAEGHGNEAIGQALFISEKTVRNHLTSLFRKLGVSNRAEAIVLVHRGNDS